METINAVLIIYYGRKITFYFAQRELIQYNIQYKILFVVFLLHKPTYLLKTRNNNSNSAWPWTIEILNISISIRFSVGTYRC